VNRDDLRELHYITPINNVLSIMSMGILSRKRAGKVGHDSVAMREIQNRRAKKVVPGGRPLHEYVNLYINARNKMLFRVLHHGDIKHADICILRVKTDILDVPEVVVVDRNASSQYARFAPAPDGFQNVDCDLVFSRYWTHPHDPFHEWQHGSIMCEEVLVPYRVAPDFIIGAYVSCAASKTAFAASSMEIEATKNLYLFFR
jgi:hypothetical protein